MNKILVILNPAARGERARSLRQTIQGLSSRIVVRETHKPGDAEALAERAVQQGFATVVAAGGDGTVNEVVNGIGQADVTFGVLPVGTMNVFALELGVDGQNLKRAWAAIERGHVREIDLPMANEEYFVQLAGVGLDAEVVRQTTPDFKKALGPVSYVLSLAQVAARKPPKLVATDASGRRHEGSFVLVGNGRYYGGPLVLFRDAKLDDGLLDVVVFKNQSHWDLMRYVQAVVFGNHHELPDVEYFQTKRVRVEADRDVPVELDGEIAGFAPFTFGFAQRKLRVLAPARVDKRKRRS
ncbi:MAG: diacylglycerol kinase family lipid kinase [Terrimicrobiaceae bacterium]|nr:diacylglycerol kinase family lipid kinase [Terrimicrobiaceae bacterium]